MPAKILVVDDDALICEQVSKILRDAGYQVCNGADGREALAKVRDEQPDLIVMDVEMPYMGGCEVCRIVKNQKRSFGFIPIILMTAIDDMNAKVEGLELGADDYLVKPLHWLELTARVKSMLRLKALQTELQQANKRLQNANEKLQELSMTDPLMGIYNRLYFHKRLDFEFQRSSRYQTPLALLLLDLDHFKRINDTHGHPFGDHVLKETAKLLQSCVRSVDIVARYGGEEIVIACPETDQNRAMCLAERVRESMERYVFEIDGIREKVTTSIGVDIIPNPEIKSPEELLGIADKALYEAKLGGRNCIRVRKNKG